MKKTLSVWYVLVIMALVLSGCASPATPEPAAVTEAPAETGIQVDVIAVGTGQALTLGQDGNADVLLVHTRAREDEFMAAGHGVRGEDGMYNDFVIGGPEGGPTGR